MEHHEAILIEKKLCAIGGGLQRGDYGIDADLYEHDFAKEYAEHFDSMPAIIKANPVLLGWAKTCKSVKRLDLDQERALIEDVSNI